MWMTLREAMLRVCTARLASTRGEPPARHFRTSAMSLRLLRAMLSLLHEAESRARPPGPLDLVDVGAGCGELLASCSG